MFMRRIWRCLRYTSPDPLGLTPALDLHNYTPNPTRWTDPLGLTPCDPTGMPSSESSITRVFRVESPANARLHIGQSGSVTISGEKMLFLNFGDEMRAQEFLARRLDQGLGDTAVRTFDVPTTYVENLAARARPESAGRLPGTSVITVDTGRTGASYGLRSTEFPALLAAVVPGSAR